MSSVESPAAAFSFAGMTPPRVTTLTAHGGSLAIACSSSSTYSQYGATRARHSAWLGCSAPLRSEGSSGDEVYRRSAAHSSRLSCGCMRRRMLARAMAVLAITVKSRSATPSIGTARSLCMSDES